MRGSVEGLVSVGYDIVLLVTINCNSYHVNFIFTKFIISCDIKLISVTISMART